MVGLTSVTNVTMQNITDIINITRPDQLFTNVSNNIYGGWFWFIMLFVLWVVLFVAANKVRDQPLNNAMYSGAAVTVIAFLMRGASWLTDYQLWVFPLITIIIAVILWVSKPQQ